MASSQPQYSIKTAAVIPSLFTLPFSLPQSSDIHQALGSTRQNPQILKPLVYNYIAAVHMQDSTYRSSKAVTKSGADGRPLLRIDTRVKGAQLSRFQVD